MQQTITTPISFDQQQPRYTTISTADQLRLAAESFFTDLKSSPSYLVLRHFSTTELVIFDHSPRSYSSSRLFGINAIRSYLDLLATHWTCSDMLRHRTDVSLEMRRVVVNASVTWKWKKSGNSWREDFTCTLEYDEAMKIRSFVIKTDSAPETCVMRAVDH